MSLRIVVGSFLAGWLVLGASNSATGQVWLEAPILDVSADDDRFGDYEPVPVSDAKPDHETTGPLLVAQTNDWVQPPGQIVQQPAPISPRADSANTSLPQAGPTLAPPLTPYVSPMPQPPVISPPVEIYDGYAQPMVQSYHQCPPWRPCGPDESFGGNWLFPQGFAGADYRPACATHDACLMSGCYSRKACDKMLLANMDCACHNSMFPILCRLEARKCYAGVRLFGWLWY